MAPAQAGRGASSVGFAGKYDFGAPLADRVDAPATVQQKKQLGALSPDKLGASELAGETIDAVLDKAPGNGAAIGGIKVIAKSGWFAARPSGTEEVYKIYAESFRSQDHLRQIQADAQRAITRAFEG